MSYKDNISLIRQELVDNFINDLKEIKKLTLESRNKEELINKIKDDNKLIDCHSYYYIKDEKFEDIMPKLDLLLMSKED